MVRHLRRRRELGHRSQLLSNFAKRTKRRERNSLSGKTHLPRAEATLHVNPAHNGEPLTGFERSAEEECRGKPSAS